MNFPWTEFLAIYGAIVATASATISATQMFVDRGNLKVDIMVGTWLMSGPQPSNPPKSFVITVTNIGRRPIQVTHFGMDLMRPEDKKMEAVVFPTPGALPKILKEHESLQDRFDNREVINNLLKNMKAFYVMDASGKKYFAPKSMVKKAVKKSPI